MARISSKQRELFDNLHNSRAADFKTFNKKSYRGVWSSIIDKYPESAHFVYELLQNADDADATEVYIILQRDRMIFKHNGTKHFDITEEDAEKVGDINSITGIGDSSKIDTQNKIGKFGVGFKAVFQYTDTPEIYDDYFKFKIENYIIPTLLDCDHPERKEGETLFVFPFKNGEQSYMEILRRFNTIQEPILFLRKLQRIVLRIDGRKGEIGQEVIYSKKVIDTVKYKNDNILLEHYKLVDQLLEREILLFSQEIEIVDVDSDKSTKHIINVGFYYDPDKKCLITDNEQNIHCFFPTKETFKTCFITHAPFLLTDNRQNLKPGEPQNKLLVNLLAKLAAKAVLCLRDYKIDKDTFLINENLTEIIPNYQKSFWKSLNDLFEEPIKESFTELVETERILLSRNNKYLSLHEAYIGTPRKLVDLLSQQQFSQLQTEEYSYSDENDLFKIKNIDFLKWDLSQNILNQKNEIYEDIEEYTSEKFANNINVKFMSEQEMKWVTRMYTFLRTAAPELWKITEKDKSKQAGNLPFRSAPIIKTQKGEWVAPFIDGVTPNVYLPLKDDKESEYNFISREYIDNDLARKFFNELDIKEPAEYDYIRQVILKKFSGNKISNKDLVSDFLIIVGYYQQIKDISQKESEFISLLKDKLYLRGLDGELHSPSDLYFDNEQLDKYLGGQNPFVNIHLYTSHIQRYSVSTIKDFLIKLGVKVYPSIIPYTRPKWAFQYRLSKKINTNDISQGYVEDFELEGFEYFCKHLDISKETSLFIWNKVLPAIGFSSYGDLTYHYKRKYARSFEHACYTSSFKESLQCEKWLFDINGQLVSAKDIALEDLDSGYDRNNGLINFLEIEKREKSILELGGTEEQQFQMELGKRIRSMAGDDLSEDEIMQAIVDAKAKKKGRGYTKSEEKDVCYDSNDLESKQSKGQTSTNVEIPQTHENEYVDEVFENIDNESEVSDYSDFSRKELRKTDLSEMFVQPPRKSNKTESSMTGDTEEVVDSIMQKLVEEEEKRNHINELRDIASTSDKYSKEWFDALIELEYRGGTETDNSGSTKSFFISFNTVKKEIGSERIYVFKNPSRGVPMWMEEMGDIEVKCTFSNREDISLKFEVANVRDNCLRLKASKAYEEILNKLDWSKCTKASITLKNQIDLMGKLRTAFNALGFESGFNLKEHLDNNIRFIFGPPGTGKTTTLANKIIAQINSNETCRILVLAPTNTACDELAKKIQEYSNNDCAWLYRFVSTANENLEDIVIDRESIVYDDNKCCIISTMARLSFDGFSGLGGNNRLTDIGWDMIICDEASMIPLAEIVLTIYTFLDTPILIAGDPMQIKPILHEEEWKDENIYSMVKLDRFDKPQTEPIQFDIENLGVQYRSVPAIGELFSQYAYDGKLQHYRNDIEHDAKFGKLSLKPINFIPFKVEKYDSIFGVKKLDGSNVHIYSALFTVELLKYILQKYADTSDNEFSIGIVCPYSPQVQLIESLISQMSGIPVNVNVIVGTVHRFQGGQCNMMLVVLNPPMGMKVAAERIFLNNKNILNVAISRAQDYLCILLPHKDTDGYENLYEINTIGNIAMRLDNSVLSYTCDEIEEIIFGRKFYIESNTFVTSHQLTNVYTKASKKYEVRIDEKSIDIQLGGNITKVIKANDSMVSNDVIDETLDGNSSIIQNKEDVSNDDVTLSNAEIYVKEEIDKSRSFSSKDEYYSFFKRVGMDIDEAIELLITANTKCSMFVLVQILGNKIICEHFNWRVPQEEDIKKHKNKRGSYNLFRCIYPQLFSVLRNKLLPIKNVSSIPIGVLRYGEFDDAFSLFLSKSQEQRHSVKPKVKSVNKASSKTPSYGPYQSNHPYVPKTGKLYSDFEYGLSDW